MESYHVQRWMQAKQKVRKKVWAKNVAFPETSQRTFRI